jgi:hypothetical protein
LHNFFRDLERFFKPSHVSNRPKTLPISHVQLKMFGHIRENSPEFLRAPMARLVPRRVLPLF